MSRILTKTVLRLTRPQRLAHWRALQRSQWLDLERLTAGQSERLAALLRHALSRVPFHRSCGLSADEAQADPLAALAALPRSDKASLMAAGRDVLDERAVPADLRASSTGGSSGTPFRFYLDPGNRELRYALDYRTRGWAGWRMGDKMVKLWGHHADVRRSERWQGRLRSMLVNRTLTVNTFALKAAEIDDVLAGIRRYRAPLIIGYANALAFLAREMRRGGQPPPPGLRGVISTAESLSSEARNEIETVFAMNLLDRYGSREFGTIAQQCELCGGLHVNVEHVVLEILDPDGRPCRPGERGEIVITDLDNYAMPFLRYRTGDLAAWADAPCPCGRGLPTLTSVEGRVSDLLVARDGTVIACPGPTFFLGEIVSVKQLQILQVSRDEVLLTVVPGEGWSDDERRRLRERMRELLGEVTVGVNLVDAIPVTASGKYRFSESRVSPYL